MNERCATGEHRGTTLLELAAVTQAAVQQAITEGVPGYEHFLAVQDSARRLWPRLCGAPVGCYQPRKMRRKHVCQLWTQTVREHDWERLSASYRGLMEHMRELYPELCA